jgi:hypothetical protein
MFQRQKGCDAIIILRDSIIERKECEQRVKEATLGHNGVL